MPELCFDCEYYGRIIKYGPTDRGNCYEWGCTKDECLFDERDEEE